MNATSRFVIKHRWRVVAGWIAAIVPIQVLAIPIGGARYQDNVKLAGTESQTVADLLSRANLSQQSWPERDPAVARQRAHWTTATP